MLVIESVLDMLDDPWTSTYTHEPSHQVIGVGVVFFWGQLGWVEFGGPQNLQNTIQSLRYYHGTAFLCCVNDIYHL